MFLIDMVLGWALFGIVICLIDEFTYVLYQSTCVPDYIYTKTLIKLFRYSFKLCELWKESEIVCLSLFNVKREQRIDVHRDSWRTGNSRVSFVINSYVQFKKKHGRRLYIIIIASLESVYCKYLFGKLNPFKNSYLVQL